MSEDATVNRPETRAAWTPEGEVKPPAPKVDEDAVIAAISTVYDPEIPVDIYQLGLIYAIEIEDDGRVRIEMTLTTPACPSAQELPNQVEATIVEADAVVKGQTASSSYKPAVLDNGVRIMVPPHIESGTRIIVDVYEQSYVGKAG